MAMILPERTVDAWTASYITGRRWRARLWAPTEQLPGERYDLGFGLGRVLPPVGLAPQADAWPDKVFVFEHKGVDERSDGTPFVRVRLRQLLTHLDADRRAGGGLVYYLLPDPEWRGRQPAPYGVLPPVAVRRTRGPAWSGFQCWAVTAPVEGLAAYLLRALVVSPGRFVPRTSRGTRRDDYTIDLLLPEIWTVNDALCLRDFISAVRDCNRGRAVADLAPTPPADLGPSLIPGMAPNDPFAGSLARAARALGANADMVREVEGWRSGEGAADDDAYEDMAGSFVTYFGVGDAEDPHED